MRVLWRSLLLAGLLLGIAAVALAAVYRWVDQDGKVHFSDTPPADAAAQEVSLPDSPPSTPKPVKALTPAPAVAPPPAASRPASAAQVEIYMTDWCPYCRKAESWFAARNIPFQAYDIEKDRTAAQRKAQLSRARGVPLVVVCGEQIPGYSPKDFEEALQDCP